MTKENCFPMFRPSYELKAYIQQKKAEIERNLQNGRYQDSEKAKNFAGVLTEIVKLPCFGKENVLGVLNETKKRLAEIGRSLPKYKAKIDELGWNLETVIAEQEDEERDDEDRWEREQRRVDLRYELEELEEYSKGIEREQKLLRNLQGIIMKPTGFFSTLK